MKLVYVKTVGFGILNTSQYKNFIIKEHINWVIIQAIQFTSHSQKELHCKVYIALVEIWKWLNCCIAIGYAAYRSGKNFGRTGHQTWSWSVLHEFDSVIISVYHVVFGKDTLYYKSAKTYLGDYLNIWHTLHFSAIRDAFVDPLMLLPFTTAY